MPHRAGGSAGHYYLKSSILKAGDMAELHNDRAEQARRSRRKLRSSTPHAPPLSIITTRSTSSASASSTSTPPYKTCTCMHIQDKIQPSACTYQTKYSPLTHRASAQGELTNSTDHSTAKVATNFDAQSAQSRRRLSNRLSEDSALLA